MIDLILMQRVDKLGQMGERVKVRPGYARNFLLPTGKAIRASKANLERFERDRVQLEADNIKRRGEAERVAERVAGLAVMIIRQAGEMGQLYGSVAPRDLADLLTQGGFTVERSYRRLDGTPADGHTTAQVEAALRAEIARIAAEGVPQAELDRVKVQYVAGQVYKRDSIFGQAMEIAGLEITGLSYRDADRILEKVRSVTVEEVKSVAARYFGDQALTIATLLPQPIAPGKPAAAPAGLRH
jgi:large subunit ribosomal protein L9